ncbi:MAG: hypothetical protein Fur0032_23960 [Terrimicrobiaceae bacterium]
MAYRLLTWISETLRQSAESCDWSTLRELLGAYSIVTTVLPLKDGGVWRIRKPSLPDPEQALPYRTLRIDWKLAFLPLNPPHGAWIQASSLRARKEEARWFYASAQREKQLLRTNGWSVVCIRQDELTPKYRAKGLRAPLGGGTLDMKYSAQHILIMFRTQIQLPDALYRDVRRIAEQQEWSVTEVIRRGAETMTRLYPPEKLSVGDGWRFPPPLKARLLVSDPASLKALVRDDEERGA